MALESAFSNINDLNPAWPTPTDSVSEGDDHLRGIKSALQGNVFGSGTATELYAGSVNKPTGPVVIADATGLTVRPASSVGATAVLIKLQTQPGVTVAEFARTLGVLRLAALTLNENLILQVTTAAGLQNAVTINGTTGQVQVNGLVVALAGVPVGSIVGQATDLVIDSLTGAVSLGFAGVIKAITGTLGLTVGGSAAAVAQLGFRGVAGEALTQVVEANGTALNLGAATGGIVSLKAGANNLITAAPTTVSLYINNVAEMTLTSSGLSMTNLKITNLGAPTSGSDAATRTYVDNAIVAPQPTFTARVDAAGTFLSRTGFTATITKPSTGTYLLNFSPSISPVNMITVATPIYDSAVATDARVVSTWYVTTSQLRVTTRITGSNPTFIDCDFYVYIFQAA